MSVLIQIANRFVPIARRDEPRNFDLPWWPSLRKISRRFFGCYIASERCGRRQAQAPRYAIENIPVPARRRVFLEILSRLESGGVVDRSRRGEVAKGLEERAFFRD